MAFVLAPLRALDIAGALDTADALDRTGGLPRAALVAMLLQEPAHQLLAPPVQFPFKFALAQLSGFAGGEEGFGIRKNSIGRRAGRSMRGTPVRGSCTSTVRPWNPVATAIAGPPFPRHRTRTPRECPEGSAPEGDRRVTGVVIGSGGGPKRGGRGARRTLSPLKTP